VCGPFLLPHTDPNQAYCSKHVLPAACCVLPPLQTCSAGPQGGRSAKRRPCSARGGSRGGAGRRCMKCCRSWVSGRASQGSSGHEGECITKARAGACRGSLGGCRHPAASLSCSWPGLRLSAAVHSISCHSARILLSCFTQHRRLTSSFTLPLTLLPHTHHPHPSQVCTATTGRCPSTRCRRALHPLRSPCACCGRSSGSRCWWRGPWRRPWWLLPQQWAALQYSRALALG
jgi:hypothetical protein